MRTKSSGSASSVILLALLKQQQGNTVVQANKKLSLFDKSSSARARLHLNLPLVFRIMSNVVGVDLGLQNSVIAAAGRGGVDVILNENSNRLNPSMVGFDQARKMGEQAANGAVSQYANTIKFMKRLVGLKFDSEQARQEMQWVPFTCAPISHKGGPATIGVKVNLNETSMVIPIEAACGMLVKHMGKIAMQKSSSTQGSESLPQDWVIAVPAYYTDAQRRSLLIGCEMAGIKGVQRLMNEHTATALAYGIFKDVRKEFESATSDNPTHVMFIDMGASAYTVSIVAFEPGRLTVKSVHYDAMLGGRDFDRLIAEWLSVKFVEKYKNKKLSANPWEKPKVRLKLMAAAEKAKKTLSPRGVKEASIHLECLMDDLDFNIKLQAKEFEAMCEPLLQRLAEPIIKALSEANLESKDLASTEIVGGSTRINSVKRRLMEVMNISSLSTTMNADEAVARGAAMQSAILSPRFKVLPYDIAEAQLLPIKISWDEDGDEGKGIEVDLDDGVSDMAPNNSAILVDRGLSFPVVRRITLRRSGAFSVKCNYDESAHKYGLPEGTSRDIASFSIKAPCGETQKVRVNVKMDIHGILSLSSAQMVEEVEEEEDKKKENEQQKEDQEGGKEVKKKKLKKTNLEFSEKRPIDWTQEEIDKAYEREVQMENNDRVVRETADMRNELESYIYDMRDKLSADPGLSTYFTQGEMDAFTSKLQEVENWLYEDGFDATKSVYAEKLSILRKLGGPGEYRQSEAESRPSAVSTLQRNLDSVQSWLKDAKGQDKYAHITGEEFDKCVSKCDEASNWLFGMLDKQGSLASNVDPAFTVADLLAKNTELMEICTPVMNKPVPRPKKEPALPTKKDTPVKDEKAEAVDDGEPMDTDETPSGQHERMDVDK